MRVLFRSHFECAARRVSDEVGVRLGKERGENDAARKHDGNAIVHVARHASFQSPPGGGILTSLPRPPAARSGPALAMPPDAAVRRCDTLLLDGKSVGIIRGEKRSATLTG